MNTAADQFDPSHFAHAARSEKEFLKQYVPQDDDEGVSAYFYKKEVHQPFESRKQGKDIFKSVDYVCIRVLGNDKSEYSAPARDDDKRRFPYAWQQYQQGKEQAVKGTPLEDLGIPGNMVNAYYAKNIFTVEDLSRVTDSNLQFLPSGTRETRHKARQLIETRGKKGEADELKAIVEKQGEQLAFALSQNAELSKQLTQALAALENARSEPAPAPKPRKAATASE